MARHRRGAAPSPTVGPLAAGQTADHGRRRALAGGAALVVSGAIVATVLASGEPDRPLAPGPAEPAPPSPPGITSGAPPPITELPPGASSAPPDASTAGVEPGDATGVHRPTPVAFAGPAGQESRRAVQGPVPPGAAPAADSRGGPRVALPPLTGPVPPAPTPANVPMPTLGPDVVASVLDRAPTGTAEVVAGQASVGPSAAAISGTSRATAAITTVRQDPRPGRSPAAPAQDEPAAATTPVTTPAVTAGATPEPDPAPTLTATRRAIAPGSAPGREAPGPAPAPRLIDPAFSQLDRWIPDVGSAIPATPPPAQPR